MGILTLIRWNHTKINASPQRQHLKSPQSLSSGSLQLILVNKRSWSWMSDSHPFCTMSISPSILRYGYFDIWFWSRPYVWSKFKVTFLAQQQFYFPFNFTSIGSPIPEIQLFKNLSLKILGQGHGQGQSWWLHLRHSALSISSFFVSWQYNHFAIRCNNYLTSKFKVKFMAMVKPGHHIWSLGFNRNVSLSFCGNQTIFGWDLANSIFDWKFKVKVMNKIDQI